MKTQLLKNSGKLASVALLSAIMLSPNADAIVLAYESAGPWGPAGTPYLGTVQFKFNALDEGTLYNTGPGQSPPSAGYSGSPGAGVAGGILAVNALVPGAGQSQIIPTNAGPGTIVPASNEDSWGVGTVTSILTPSGDIVWSPVVKGAQLTAVFFGEQDFHVQPDPNNPGFDTVLSGAGFRLNIYEDAGPVTPLNLAGGPGLYAAGTYPNANDGILQLSLASTPGFIRTNTGAGGPSPGFGGAATEYSSTFNFGALSGLGVTFFNVIGGAQALDFNTNSITSPAGDFNAAAGVIPSRFADFRANFTVGPGEFGFDVTANDPLTGLAVPEPSAVLVGLACLLPMIGRNRRQKPA